MIYIEYAKRRYDAALSEIERLKQSEFPYQHIRGCLLQLEDLFRDQRKNLEKLTASSTPEVAKNACSQSLQYLFVYLPLLGFILRSTNVRNAFELYPPVLRLARGLLGEDTKLLLSSEWDYSPFTYMPLGELPNSVLIGIPAFESANPLLVALAGHEIGHNIWNQDALGDDFDDPLRDAIVSAILGKHWDNFSECFPRATKGNLTQDMFVREAWLLSHSFAMKQLEEIFCDVMGLRLFAESFLHAFAYLLSPFSPGYRTPIYPSNEKRVQYLLRGSTALGIDIPMDYSSFFNSQEDSLNPATQLLVDIADDAVDTFVDDLIILAQKIADERLAPKRSTANVIAITEELVNVMPADGNQSLTDLVNAGWVLYHDPDLWSDVPQIRPEKRHQVLFDLILKSCEVSEYKLRTETT